MTTYARLSQGVPDVADGTVMEVVDLAAGQTPQTNYEPMLAATFVECPDNVRDWWTYVDGQWSPPTPPMPAV